MKTVAIAPHEKKAIRAALSQLPAENLYWIWIGEGAPDTTALNSRGKQLDIHESLKQFSYGLHDEYVRYVGRISAAQGGDWWRTAISEKNPYVSSAFFGACCVKACLQAIAESEEGTSYLIVTPDTALRQALNDNLIAAGCDVRLVDPLANRMRTSISGPLQVVAHQAYFVLKNSVRVVYARYRYRLHQTLLIRTLVKNRTPVVVTNVWVDRRAYSPNTGEFKDVDFSQVGAALRANGKTVIGLANILNAASYPKVTNYIYRSKSAFLVQHAFLRIRDVFASALGALARPPRRRPFPKFSGIEITDLLFSDLKREWRTSRDAPHRLIERWVERLKQSGVQVERFIYTFENHTWERVICKALKAAYPSVRLIGYQPNGLPLMMLNYFVSDEESRRIPMPDRIITNGVYSARVLAGLGFGPDRVLSGGGLRQTYLQALLYRQNGRSFDRPKSRTILVTPSIGRDRTIELIGKTVAAFRNAADLRVIIKFHPTIRVEQMQLHLNNLSVPPHISISTQSINELLPTVGLLIYNDGTFPSVEALTFGIPVVFVEPDYGLSLDSLDGFPEIRLTARTPGEILAAARRSLEASDEQQRTKWLAVVRQLVGEVTDETLQFFSE